MIRLASGKLVLNILEAIRRKPLKPEHEGIITMIGVGMILGIKLGKVGDRRWR